MLQEAWQAIEVRLSSQLQEAFQICAISWKVEGSILHHPTMVISEAFIALRQDLHAFPIKEVSLLSMACKVNCRCCPCTKSNDGSNMLQFGRDSLHVEMALEAR